MKNVPAYVYFFVYSYFATHTHNFFLNSYDNVLLKKGKVELMYSFVYVVFPLTACERERSRRADFFLIYFFQKLRAKITTCVRALDPFFIFKFFQRLRHYRRVTQHYNVTRVTPHRSKLHTRVPVFLLPVGISNKYVYTHTMTNFFWGEN